MSFSFLLNTKFENLWFLVPIDFHSIFFPTMEVNGDQQLSSYQHSSKCIILCSNDQRNTYKSRTTWGWI